MKELIFNTLGKKKSSPEFIANLNILGRPILEEDIDSDIVDYTWDNIGVNIVLSYNTDIFTNIFFYPNGAEFDEGYNPNQGSCKPICKENDFDQNLTMQEIRAKYGAPDTEKDTYLGYVFRYRDIDGYKRFFTFTDKAQIFSMMIGLKA